MKSIFLCIELILIVATRNFEGINSSPLSSDLSSFGSEFYLGFPINYVGARNLSFAIHTLKTTNVQFSVSSPYNNWQVSGTTTAGFPAVVDISTDLEVRGYSFPYRHLGLHISSLETEPISIVGWSYYAAYSFMTYLGLPCHEQPTNQYTYYGVSTNGYLYFVSTILLVACKNNTNTTVVPSQNITIPVNLQPSISATKTFLKGTSHSFILNAGQTLLLYKSYADLSGTKIVADAPLTVLSGHQVGQVPLGVTDADPLVTQLTPTITWGKTFLLSPQPGRNNGQFYKVVAYRNNTNISRKCGNSNTINTTLTAGQVYQFNTSGTTYCSVISNKPIYIAQIGPSTLYNGGHSGDPTINTIPPIEQYIHSFEFSSFAPAYTYFSLLIPNDEYFNQGVVYDGVTYNFTWTNIYYPNGTIAGYGFNAFTSGNHSIRHTHPQGKLFASICGWTTYGGHCYSGGMRLNPINPPVPLAEISFITDKFSVTEGNSAVVITLNRSVNYEEEVTVKVKVTPLPVDTATVNEDYQSTSVVVIFESDLTTKSLSIPIIDDNFVESTEYFTITLEAIGDNVLAFPITEAVVSIQDNDYGCKLPASSGPCTGTYPRWFFNMTSKQCEHFSYGGCYGNSNRFGTLQECINACGCPDGISVQCSTNPCHNSSCPSYTNAVCEVDKCNSTCIAKYYVGFNEVTNICNSCELPASTGSCSGNETRWYYKSGTCQQFTYSGCGGNKNNFKTIQDCVDTCDSKCPAGAKDVYCFNDLCQVSHCPNYPEAKCVTRSCGKCTAHYYDTSGVDITALCATCPSDSPPVTCLIDVCEHQNCLQFPQAQCMIDNCGSCKPKFFLNGTEVTNQCSACPVHGQIFKTCALSCRRTCTDLILHNTVICDAACKPGCECTAGQVIDETGNKCVYPQSCPCPSCQPVSPNCTNTTTPNNHLCSCPICIDCPVRGQVYKKSNVGCPRTCTSLDILCTGHTNPGCSCPDGQVVDEMKNACVPVSSCPKPNPCTFEAYKGPCNGQLQRYFHNSTSSNCEVFQYGGCYGNENNFFTKHDCEERCSDCPPVCSQEFCSAKRNAICSIQSSPIQGTCQMSNCLACYYSYTELSLPVNDCTTNCVSNGQINKSCVAKWGRCIRRAYYSTHSKIQPHERVASNFRCWSYPL